MRRGLLSFIVLWLVFPPGGTAADPVGMKGKIRGESYVNLRSGPDVGHPSKGVLREGEEVVVEREQRSWYLVSLADGRKGYVYKNLVQLIEKMEIQEPEKGETLTQTAEEEKRDLQPSPPKQRVVETPRAGPLPLIKVLEGKEWEILWWLGVALCIFIIGWICGGNYYLRRDRIRKRKIHF